MSIAVPDGDACGGARSLLVKATFHLTDEHHAQTVSAKMIDMAHQIANLPECECDVDVCVELTTQSELTASQLDASSAPARGRLPKR